MDVTLDIGAVLIGIGVPLTAVAFNAVRKRQAKATSEAQERQHIEDEKRERIRLARDRNYRDLKEAIEIHASLSELPVSELLKRSDEDAKRVLVELHKRSSARFNALSNDFSIPDDVAELVVAALLAINAKWPDETKDSQAKAERVSCPAKSSTGSGMLVWRRGDGGTKSTTRKRVPADSTSPPRKCRRGYRRRTRVAKKSQGPLWKSCKNSQTRARASARVVFRTYPLGLRHCPPRSDCGSVCRARSRSRASGALSQSIRPMRAIV